MAADEITEGEATEAEEATEVEPDPPLDQAALLAEAEARVARISARGKDASKTYAGYVVDLLSANKAALDAALRAEATVRLDGVLGSSSDIYRKHSLAGKVQIGNEFDA